ncbi:D-tyrosyl-tRNA(Tyr) deacylase [Batrachochytrium dendrobatidis]
MRAVIQRVSSASVTVDGTVVSRINNGLCILVGLKVGDTDTEMDYITKKIMGLKVFQGTQSGKQWDANIKDINGDVLCVSQFTLYAKTSKGNKPDFHLAMKNTESGYV